MSGPLDGEEYLVGDGLQIGRSGELGVQLINSAISRRHAEVRVEPDGTCVLVDLNSRNGTFFNGERVERHVLRHGDVFEIGRSAFCLEERSGAPPAGEDEQQLILLGGLAEDVTETFQRAQLFDAGMFRPTTHPSAECQDPLHALARDKGWRFCPVCGEPPGESMAEEQPIAPPGDSSADS